MGRDDQYSEIEGYTVIAFGDRCDFTGADLRRAREALEEG